MGKHGTPISQSSVISHFKKHGYENIPLDDFQNGLYMDCIFLQFTKFINSENRRGPHIDVWMACGYNYACEYRRGQAYVNRSLDDNEDMRLWGTKLHIKPISFEIHITGHSLPINVVNSVIDDNHFAIQNTGILGVNINLKRADILLNRLDKYKDVNVPKMARYFQ